jgi:acetoin utilization protein AcuC
LPIGICDAAYLEVFTEIVVPLIKAYDPDIFVLQTGMDALAGDALAHLELTNNAHAEIINRLLRFDKPLLATGGGGYHVDNTVRGWALAWKIMCGVGDESDIALGMGGSCCKARNGQVGSEIACCRWRSNIAKRWKPLSRQQFAL